MNDNAETLAALMAPPVEAMGYELVQVELGASRDSRGPVLRAYIDAPGGIALDDCVAVSRQLSALLDAEDPLSGAYQLEVSSPGLDRPLVKPGDFQRFVGDQIQLVARTEVSGRRRFRGRLAQADAAGVTLECDNQTYAVTYANIESARLQPAFPSARRA